VRDHRRCCSSLWGAAVWKRNDVNSNSIALGFSHCILTDLRFSFSFAEGRGEGMMKVRRN
jgi:hypothetical protein